MIKMKLSIIIPTYNEENYLPILLESIESQGFDDYEVIVADANSNDDTVLIAENYNCKVVEGGMPGVGRNKGAEVAKGEILLFLDSDLELSPNYLEELVTEFEDENIGIGITKMNPISDRKRHKILHDLANLFMIASEKIKPHGAGCYGIVTKKELHDEYSGFDETLTFGEDTDYIERIGKEEKFKVLRNPVINVSVRRLEEEGVRKLLKQYGKSTFNDFRGVRTTAEELEYGFNHETKEVLDNHLSEKESIHENDLSEKESFLEKTKEEEWSKIQLKDSKQLINESMEESTALINKATQDKIKIFYAVCGEGMGHAVRSGVILDELTNPKNKDKYEVYIFSSERAYNYLNDKFDNVFEIGGLNTVYEDNVVKNKKTLLNAIKATPTNLKENYDILYKKTRELKPNIIISDFENYSSVISNIRNIPLICLDNIQMITQTKIDYPPFHRRDLIKAKGVIKSYIVRPKRYILTSFFNPEVKHPEKAVIYPPVIREKIKNLETSYGDYILVYQTSSSNTELLETLKQFDEKFIVYGYNEEKKDKNLTLRTFNENQIYDDMRNAKAVITNGGFSLITEAIYLKKPIYSIPAVGNFEQILNGFYVEKLGYGEVHTEITKKLFDKFLANVSKYQKNLEKLENTDNNEIIEELEKSIALYSKKY